MEAFLAPGPNLLEKDSRTKYVGKIFKKLANRCADLEKSKSKQAAQLCLIRTKNLTAGGHSGEATVSINESGQRS